MICQRDSNLDILGKLVSSMNAWDERRVDQPNYEIRLATHKEINSILADGTPSFEWTCFVLYNCFYFVRTVIEFFKEILIQFCFIGRAKFQKKKSIFCQNLNKF